MLVEAFLALPVQNADLAAELFYSLNHDHIPLGIVACRVRNMLTRYESCLHPGQEMP